MEKVTLKLTCEKCKKTFNYTYSYPKGLPDPCMQGMIPSHCENIQIWRRMEECTLVT